MSKRKLSNNENNNKENNNKNKANSKASNPNVGSTGCFFQYNHKDQKERKGQKDSFPTQEEISLSENDNTIWEVNRSKIIKVLKKANDHRAEFADGPARNLFRLSNILIQNLRIYGPYRKEATNYTPDNIHNLYHCHVLSGHPTYVMIWDADFDRKIITVHYLGTHENAPYDMKIKKVRPN